MAKVDVKQPTGTIPGNVSHRSSQLFQALSYTQFLHIAFVHDVDKDLGHWLTVNPKHCDYQSSIVLTLVIVTNTSRL